MSEERELLKRVRDTLLELKETHYDLYWDIQTALDQPESEPLSDATIAELWGDKHSGKTFMVKNFARAIEQQHGIGGGE
jgi:hypothetical protein